MQLFQESAVALGSEVQLTFTANREEQAQKLFKRLWQIITDFDERFSRFRIESELTQFNVHAGQWVPISPAFRAILAAAQSLAQATDDAYNPFVLPALQQAGYQRSFVNHHLPDAPNFAHRKVVPSSALELKAKEARIPKEAALDLGGCGKGYLLDILADYLEDAGATNYWLSLGGDIITRGKDEKNQLWGIGIADARRPEKVIAEVRAGDARTAIATSGITKRKGEHDGKPWHHLIDSKTGKPARTDILTATVVAGQGIVADVYASCLVRLGSAKAQSYGEGIIKDSLLQIDNLTDVTLQLQGQRIQLL